MNLFSKIREWLSPGEKRRINSVAPRPLIDWTRISVALDHSPVPGLFVMILVWTVSSVLLTLTMRYQLLGVQELMEGQTAPRTILAKFDFQFEDIAHTDQLRQEQLKAQPLFFRVDSKQSLTLLGNMDLFFRAVEQRVIAEKARQKYSGFSSMPEKLASELSPELLSLLSGFYHHPSAMQTFQEELSSLLSRGLLNLDEKAAFQVGQQLRIIDGGGRESLKAKAVTEQPDPRVAAGLLAEAILKFYPADANNASLRDKLSLIMFRLLGNKGNLRYDSLRTDEVRNRAVSDIKPVLRTKNRGEPLIRRGQKVSRQLEAMLAAYTEQERVRSTVESELAGLGHNMLWSLVLVIFAGFYLYHLHPDVVRSSKRTALLGLVIIMALFANYGALRFFNFLVSENRNLPYDLLPNALPTALVSVLLAVMFGFRVAMCAGFFVSSILAMMIESDQSFSLALKGMVLCSLAALAVRSATNYRSYFMRIILSVFPLCWMLNLNAVNFEGTYAVRAVAQAGFLSLGNSLMTAILALVLIFFFELAFNVSTNMALMVLCDYNHPLLERLKREAPGTFFHSLMVATLVEDAARAIGANPLKAKAGALFHDIGKLSMPQYFTENNINMANQHLDLNPQMSSIIIRDHVKEGLALAGKYRMCRAVRDAISQHHGNDLVHYFYAKALENEKKNPFGPSVVLESQFRYPGVPPRNKEMAIISLADACEAACRSLDKPSAGRIAEQVDEIFLRRFQDGQLNGANLTLAELHTVRNSFVNTLVSMKHGRIAYQKGIVDDDKSQSAPEHEEAPRA